MNRFILGAVALAGVAMTAPVNAQGVYFGFGDAPRYRSYDDGYRHDRPYRAYRSYGYDSDYRRCRLVRVWDGDGYRRIRRCSSE